MTQKEKNQRDLNKIYKKVFVDIFTKNGIKNFIKPSPLVQDKKLLKIWVTNVKGK